jgi:hypothetical protein
MSGWDSSIGESRYNLKRREFIALACAFMTAIGAARTVRYARAVENPVPAWLVDAVSDSQAAARFGAVYLASHPSEQEASALTAAIRQTVSRFRQVRGNEVGAEGFELLDQLVREEYARGEVIRIDGWLLSRTEARLYALAFLG